MSGALILSPLYCRMLLVPVYSLLSLLESMYSIGTKAPIPSLSHSAILHFFTPVLPFLPFSSFPSFFPLPSFSIIFISLSFRLHSLPFCFLSFLFFPSFPILPHPSPSFPLLSLLFSPSAYLTSFIVFPLLHLSFLSFPSLSSLSLFPVLHLPFPSFLSFIFLALRSPPSLSLSSFHLIHNPPLSFLAMCKKYAILKEAWPCAKNTPS